MKRSPTWQKPVLEHHKDNSIPRRKKTPTPTHPLLQEWTHSRLYHIPWIGHKPLLLTCWGNKRFSCRLQHLAFHKQMRHSLHLSVAADAVADAVNTFNMAMSKLDERYRSDRFRDGLVTWPTITLVGDGGNTKIIFRFSWPLCCCQNQAETSPHFR